MGLDLPLFLMDSSKLNSFLLPGFYKSVFSVWTLLRKERQQQAESLHWLLQEPVLFGSLLECPVWGATTWSRLLHTARVFCLGRVVEMTGPRLDDPVELSACLGTRSVRVVGQLLSNWKHKLGEHQCSLLTDYYEGTVSPNHLDPFPSIRLFPGIKNCSGPLLDSVDSKGISLEGASGKMIYRLIVKTLNQNKLNRRSDTVWRSHLSLTPVMKPEWKSLYKPPLTKKHADLQWRILHGIVAVNSFVSVINSAVKENCPFCEQRETVYHCFSECTRLSALFVLLGTIFNSYGEVFTKKGFICGVKFTRQRKNKCQLINFLLGQAKMAIYISRKRKVEEGLSINVVSLFVNLVKSRLLLEFNFYKSVSDLDTFCQTWSYGIICSVVEGELIFGRMLM